MMWLLDKSLAAHCQKDYSIFKNKYYQVNKTNLSWWINVSKLYTWYKFCIFESYNEQ